MVISAPRPLGVLLVLQSSLALSMVSNDNASSWVHAQSLCPHAGKILPQDDTHLCVAQGGGVGGSAELLINSSSCSQTQTFPPSLCQK
ncbi:hypothetical protein INR49_031978 [Caranx melampygus]|nr:hypothetical protein INR49_031978 [Caranx melampygus]